MSALDFGAGAAANTTRKYTTGSVAVLPAGGWTVLAWVRHLAFSGNEVLVGFGTSGAASSFQLRTAGGSQYQAQGRDASGANFTCGAVYPSAGDVLLAARHNGSSLEIFIIPEGATVTGSSDDTTVTYATITPGSGWYIGSDGTDWTKTPLGEIAVFGSSLNNAQLTALAAGAPATAVGAPLLYWQFRNGATATEPNLGSAGSADATRVGTGYTTDTEFFALTSAQVTAINGVTSANVSAINGVAKAAIAAINGLSI